MRWPAPRVDAPNRSGAGRLGRARRPRHSTAGEDFSFAESVEYIGHFAVPTHGRAAFCGVFVE